MDGLLADWLDGWMDGWIVDWLVDGWILYIYFQHMAALLQASCLTVNIEYNPIVCTNNAIY